MKILGSLAVLVLGFSLSFGQSARQPATASDGSASSSPTMTRNDSGDQQDHNWGWLGLLGLAGLGGLAGRKRDKVSRDHLSVKDIRKAA